MYPALVGGAETSSCLSCCFTSDSGGAWAFGSPTGVVVGLGWTACACSPAVGWTTCGRACGLAAGRAGRTAARFAPPPVPLAPPPVPLAPHPARPSATVSSAARLSLSPRGDLLTATRGH